MAREIQAGEEYELEARSGSRVRVEAESEVWENSQGIEGFDATLLEDFGGQEAGDLKIIQTHIYEVVGQGPATEAILEHYAQRDGELGGHTPK